MLGRASPFTRPGKKEHSSRPWTLLGAYQNTFTMTFRPVKYCRQARPALHDQDHRIRAHARRKIDADRSANGRKEGLIEIDCATTAPAAPSILERLTLPGDLEPQGLRRLGRARIAEIVDDIGHFLETLARLEGLRRLPFDL
jgi:hypothetical protein